MEKSEVWDVEYIVSMTGRGREIVDVMESNNNNNNNLETATNSITEGHG